MAHLENLAVTLLTLGLSLPLSAQESSLRFEDVREKLGLEKYLHNWEYGHGAAWGDVDGDGRPDLYTGAFASRSMYAAKDAPLPNLLFLNTPSGFVRSDQKALEFAGVQARLSQATFADLDNDGDLDLVAGFHVMRNGNIGTRFFENVGHGQFRDATPKENWFERLGTRNIAAVDLNRDGLLDLVICDGTYRALTTRQFLVLENKGKLQFQLASNRYGFPKGDKEDQVGLAVGDVNDDGLPDFFIAGPNHLYVASPGGKYREVQPGTFIKPTGKEQETCGADFGDLNGDGLLDLVTTEHGQPSQVRIYLNRGITNGEPHFANITENSALSRAFPSTSPITGLPVKNAHVELQDFDNDGRVDIMLAVIYQDSTSKIQPVVLRNLGNANEGTPRFTPPPYDRLLGYYAPAPVADYDRDGRLDIFMCKWFAETPAALFHNITAGGHWLTVKMTGRGTLNPMGIGAVVRVYRVGAAGKSEALLGRADITVGTGYASGEEALAHLGLGGVNTVDLVIDWQGQKVIKTAVAADQIITIPVEAR